MERDNDEHSAPNPNQDLQTAAHRPVPEDSGHGDACKSRDLLATSWGTVCGILILRSLDLIRLALNFVWLCE
ncbi:Os06g0217850 [Oryza sativa Japonica Group]|uniref:Os06g0217850 protein n=1 Tax=Oryza sativa subsp. japonica TaxID=39947 RepID=A0A0N7KLS1_ORYSJ|nr:Os06g0217850 [Oryza sativa Japonica Group]